MFRVAVCDDDEYFRRHLGELIEEYFWKREVSCTIQNFTSGIELIERKEEIKDFHIVFLDVNMDGLNGIETAKKIRLFSKELFIVFVTAYVSYSLEGYKVDAVRYLLKDTNTLRLSVQECLDTILARLKDIQLKMMFDFQEGKKEVALTNIVYIESNLHKLTFYVEGKQISAYSMYDKLDTIENKIKLKSFCRIHKSYLVNLKYVDAIERYKVTLQNGDILNIAKPRYREVENQYICIKGEI